VPQEQDPVEQLSAVVALHALQVFPSSPHIARLGTMHSAPLQQPPGHAQLEQVPELHESPALQAVHAAPAPPHRLVWSPGSHTLPLQQPVGHDVPLHTHLPAWQTWPEPHAAFEPHVHPPDASQPSLLVALQPLQMQAPATQLRPGGHGLPPAHDGPRLP
jgi:hypothetical protein